MTLLHAVLWRGLLHDREDVYKRQALSALASILTLPPLVALSVSYFMGADAPPVDVAALGVQMFLLTAVPVGLGMALTRVMPSATPTPVSYTHLDVYKRQDPDCA